jgi:hypothetical protein
VPLPAVLVSGCSLLAPGDEELVGTRPSGYASVVLGSSPLAYWRLDEPAGATLARDASGNGHDAVVGGQPGGAKLGSGGLIDGSRGALELDGNGFLDVPSAAAFRFAGAAAFSIEAWLVPRAISVGGTVRNIAASQPLGTDGEGWFWFHNQSLFEAERRAGGGIQGVYAAGGLTEDRRVFVVATFDGERWALYRDGITLAASDQAPVVIADLDNGFRLGGRPREDGGNLFVGILDEIAIYDRALSTIEVAEHHAAGAGL